MEYPTFTGKNNTGKIVIDADVCCTKCNGTGLYKGMAERGDAAVICVHCNGTGKEHIHFEYENFVSRKKMYGINRVYKIAAGYIITDKDTVTEEGKTIHFSKCGCTYEEWENGIEPKPIKELHCPMMHFGQGTDDGNFVRENICEKVNRCFVGMYFPKCAEINRESCWKKYTDLKGE